MPDPAEWTTLEIWRLIKQPAPGSKKRRKVWECHHAEKDGKSAQRPDSFDEDAKDDKKSWKFVEDELKKKNVDVEVNKKSAKFRTAKTGDSVAIFGYTGPKAKKNLVYIPRFIVGESGCIFRRMEGIGWVRVIDRWGEAEKRDRLSGTVDYSVSGFDAKAGTLLCMNLALPDPEESQDPESTPDLSGFSYWFIDPDEGLTNTEEQHDCLFSTDEGSEEEQKEEVDIDWEAAFEILTTAKKEGKDLEEPSESFMKRVLPESMQPDVGAGSLSLLAVTELVDSIVVSGKIDAQDWGGLAAGLEVGGGVGAALGPLETGSTIWLAFLHAAFIRELRKRRESRDPKELTPQEKKLIDVSKKGLADALARLPQALSDTANAGIDIAAAASVHANLVTPDPSHAITITGWGGTVGGFVGMAVNLYIAARNFYETGVKDKLRRKFKQRSETVIYGQTAKGEALFDMDPSQRVELYTLSRYASHKLRRGALRKGLTGGLACISAFGGCAGAVAALSAIGVVGIANAWNPVGWAIGAIAIAGGIGLTGWVLYRRITRKRRHERKLKKWGVADPQGFAEKLVKFYLEARGRKDDKLENAGRDLIRSFIHRKDFEKLDWKGNPDDASKQAIAIIKKSF